MRLDEIYDTSRKYNFADGYKNYDQSEIDEVIQKVLKSDEFLELSKNYPLVSSKTQLKHGTLCFQVNEKNVKPYTYDIDVTGNIRMNKGIDNRTRLKVPKPSEDMYDRYIACINELIDKLEKKEERSKKSFNIRSPEFGFSIIDRARIRNLDQFDLSEVVNSVDLFGCNLTSLKGLPKKLNGYLNLQDNQNLSSLQYCPERIGGDFKISRCYSLSSLEYSPKSIGGDFIASDMHNISNLDFFPQNINGSINISSCKNLQSLNNIQHIVKGDFRCNYNHITSLEYAPLKCTSFQCQDNDIKLLQGIGRKYLKECQKIFLPHSIKSNILGLCKVNKLSYIFVNNATTQFEDVLKIVKKHLGTTGEECAEELRQNGYSDYAKF